MVLLMESLSTPRGASGSRRISPLLFARPTTRQALPRTPTIAEEEAPAAGHTAAAPADENAAPECAAQAWHSPLRTPCAAECSPASPAPLSACGVSPASAARPPLSPLASNIDTLALVAATPRPYAGKDFSFVGVTADVDLSSPLPSFAVRDSNEIALTPFASPVGADDCSEAASPAADVAGCGAVALADAGADSPAVRAAARRVTAAADSLMSPAVHCAATAAALCESAVLLGLCLFEEVGSMALPRVRSAGRAAAERACVLVAQVQASLDEAQTALDTKRASAWLRTSLKAMEAEGAKDEVRRASSKEAAARDKLALSHTDLAMLLR